MAEYLSGRNAVREALLAGRRRIERVLLAEGASEQGIIAEILSLCREGGIRGSRGPFRAELERLSDDLTHQGVIAQVSPYPYAELDEILRAIEGASEPAFLLVLDSLQDPQNVGALLRTADAVGIHGVIIPTRRAAQVTPAVSRASAGAVEHLRVARVTNIVRSIESLQKEGIWVAGLEGRPDAQDYRQANLDLPLALVLGSEGEGLRHLVAERCDFLLRIPMRGRVSSLNVSVAGALALYQAWHARDPL
jgi:23S rRNA (guanosine2251-2'-O)-methyltransferase